jgi:hypothetical protein
MVRVTELIDRAISGENVAAEVQKFMHDLAQRV